MITPVCIHYVNFLVVTDKKYCLIVFLEATRPWSDHDVNMPELNMSDLVRTEQVWSCPVLQIRDEEEEG